jgi:ribosomal protein S27AE
MAGSKAYHCGACGYSEWLESPKKWEHQCPECGSAGYSVSIGARSFRSINPYGGDNLGINEYIRSESHWKEKVLELEAQGIHYVG